MAIELPPYQPLPAPEKGIKLIEVPIAKLHPTQMCVGLAEVLHRREDFASDSPKQRREYLKAKPVPLVRNGNGEYWMVDRHHRLRGLLELDADASAWGYIVMELASTHKTEVLTALHKKGWLYLYNSRGIGPLTTSDLPENLKELQDDPFRSLVWKLKQEGVIEAAPLIPFHEFRWGAWLRRKALPPFCSLKLNPALPAARAYAKSAAASRLAGWIG
jgi:hypothetical protein